MSDLLIDPLQITPQKIFPIALEELDTKTSFLILINSNTNSQTIRKLIEAFVNAFHSQQNICLLLASLSEDHFIESLPEFIDNIGIPEKEIPDIVVLNEDLPALPTIIETCQYFICTDLSTEEQLKSLQIAFSLNKQVLTLGALNTEYDNFTHQITDITEPSLIETFKNIISSPLKQGMRSYLLQQQHTFESALELYTLGSIKIAAQICHQLVSEARQEIKNLNLSQAEKMAVIFYDAEFFEDAQAMYLSLIQAQPLQADYYYLLGKLFRMTGYVEYNLGQAYRYFQQALNLKPNQSDYVQALKEVEYQIQRRKRMPSIIYNTMPKSGSDFIHSVMSKGLNFAKVEFGSGIPFPYRQVLPIHLDTILEGGYFCKDHLLATKVNAVTLRYYSQKIIIHTRDPRQALLSTLVASNAQRKKKILKFSDHFHHYFSQPGFWALDLSEQISIRLKDFGFQGFIDFAQGWMEIAQNKLFDLDILFTSYEEFKADPETVYFKILDFYGIDHLEFKLPQSQKNLASFQNTVFQQVADPSTNQYKNFRSGKTDEWKSVFTSEQIEEANRQIPKHVAEFYNWELP